MVGQSKPRQELPIDASLGEICSSLKTQSCLVIKAEPGAGKTTRVPAALLDALPGRILVLEPRRLAARLSAERIASERGQACGEEVGYQIRFVAKATAATRLVFVTEGVFLRRVLDDPRLADVSAVVIDEFHERHLQTDMALAVVRALQLGARPELKLVVMSATLATAALSAYLGGAPVFEVPGRTFPVAVEYMPQPDHAYTEDRVLAAAKKALADPRCPGDLLVFLSGMQDIRRCAAHLAQLAASWDVEVLPLAADLPYAEQARVFQPGRRKIVLSTNVAETSLTLPAITGVIDLGTAKIAGHASWSGLPTLEVKKISQASAIQRAGRAGRVAAGVAYRLYSESDFLGRPAFTPPDIRRLDLAEVLLSAHALRLHAAKAAQPASVELEQLLPWFEAPDAKAAQTARTLLTYLGALDAEGWLTQRGRAMTKLPLHPRLAALVQRGLELDCATYALAAACLIGEGMLLRRGTPASTHEASDVLHQMHLVSAFAYDRGRDAAALDGKKARQILELYDQLARRLRLGGWPTAETPGAERLILCLLAGFPERVAKRRPLAAGAQTGRKERVFYNFCLGRGGMLDDSSVVQQADLILALDAAELAGQGGERGTAIYVAAELSADHLLDSPAPLLSDATATIWSEEAERVDVMQRLNYGQLIVSDTRSAVTAAHAAQVEALLWQKLRERWPKPFTDDSDLVAYHARVEALSAWPEQAEFPRFDGELLELLQAAICEGKRSFREIAAESLLSYILAQLPETLRALLNREAPGEVRLTNGKTLKLTYELGKPPFATGFIQDFYGLKATPTIGRQLPLTLHLLAPNRRPVQVTNDLAGFWLRHYPALRSEFGRRYPRHHWAEDPCAAKPFLYYNQAKASLLPKPKA